MKKFKKIVLFLISIFLLLILGFVLIIWVKSPGKPMPIIDKNGKEIPNSVSTIEKIKIGGIDQYLIIRGQDKTKPVLLMLHGGPGSPEFLIMKDPNLILEKEFIVVHWEQRGAGKSYSDNIPVKSMTVEQLIADAAEISNYLKNRFKQDKIYLMGHSWGTFLGTLLVYQHPNLFHSYTGIGQVCNQFYGERLSYEWAQKQAQKTGNQSDIETLNTLTFPDSLSDNKIWADYLAIQRDFVNKYGGGLKHKNMDMGPIYKTFIFDIPEYTISDKLNYLKGNLFSTEHLWDDVMQTNFNQAIDSLAVPVHILQGIHDYQTPYAPAKAFFDHLKAPEKHFYTFENSAHTPFLDETDKFNAIIKEKVLGNY